MYAAGRASLRLLLLKHGYALCNRYCLSTLGLFSVAIAATTTMAYKLLVKFLNLKCFVMHFPDRLSISLGLSAIPPPPRPHDRVAPWYKIQCQTPCLPKLEPLLLICVHVNSCAIHPTGTRDTEKPCLLLYVVCDSMMPDSWFYNRFLLHRIAKTIQLG